MHSPFSDGVSAPSALVLRYSEGILTMTFQERLAELGFEKYADYLQSDHWRNFRRAYKKQTKKKLCVICQSSKIEFHHITYIRLGREEFGDVVLLCDGHHEAVHKWLKDHRQAVESTQRAIDAIFRSIPGTEQNKEFERRKKNKEKKRASKLKRRAEKLAAEAARNAARDKFKLKPVEIKRVPYNPTGFEAIARRLASGIHRPLDKSGAVQALQEHQKVVREWGKCYLCGIAMKIDGEKTKCKTCKRDNARNRRKLMARQP